MSLFAFDDSGDLVGVVEPDWETLEAAIDGVPSEDPIEQARREGARVAFYRMFDFFVYRRHLTGKRAAQECQQIGMRVVMLADSMHHPCIENIENIRAFARAVGVSEANASQIKRRIRAKAGLPV